MSLGFQSGQSVLRSVAGLVVAPVVAACLIGCNGGKSVDASDPVQRIAGRLDEMTDAHAKFGSISISSPLLVTVDTADSPFTFNLNHNAQHYFANAKNEASIINRSAFSSESVLKLALAVKMSEATSEANARVLDALGRQDEDTAQQRAAAAEAYAAAKTAADARLAADLAAIETLEPNERALAEAAARKTYADALQQLAGPPPVQSALFDARVKAADAELAYDLQEAAKLPEAEQAKAMAEARRKYERSLTAASTATAAGGALVDQTAGPVSASKLNTAASPTDFRSTEAGRVLPAVGGASVPDSSAIVTASGNVVRQGVMAVLGNPSKYNGHDDKKVLLGVTMVSVDPGWQTADGYRAEVTCRVRLHYVPARAKLVEKFITSTDTPEPGSAMAHLVDSARKYVGLRGTTDATRGQGAATLDFAREVRRRLSPYNPSGHTTPTSEPMAPGPISVEGIPVPYAVPDARSPLVAAVSPFTDVESMSVSQQISERKAFAMDLAFILQALNYGAAASAFVDYAERFEQDLAQNVLASSVISFSHSGGVFGYSIVPSRQLDPARSPTNRSKRAKMSQTVRRQSFPVLMVITLDADDAQLKFGIDDRGRTIPYEPVLVVEQTSRWLPMKKSLPRLTELELAGWATSPHTARGTLTPDEWLDLRETVAELKQMPEALTELAAARAAATNTDDPEARKIAAAAERAASTKAIAQAGRLHELLGSDGVRQLVAERKLKYEVWKDGREVLRELSTGPATVKATDARLAALTREEVTAILVQYADAHQPLRSVEAVRAREEVMDIRVVGARHWEYIPASYFGYAPKPTAASAALLEVLPQTLNATSPTTVSVVFTDKLPADPQKISIHASLEGANVVRLKRVNDHLLQFDVSFGEATAPGTTVFTIKADGGASTLGVTKPVLIPAAPAAPTAGANPAPAPQPLVRRELETSNEGTKTVETFSGSNPSLVERLIGRDAAAPGNSANVDIKVNSTQNKP